VRTSTLQATNWLVEPAHKLEDYIMTIRWLMAGVAAGLIISSPGFAQDKASQKFLKEAIKGNPSSGHGVHGGSRSWRCSESGSMSFVVFR